MNSKNKSFMIKRKAFTLIELLIVIAIIGILFIVLVSKVDFATDKAKTTGVQTDFRSFQMAFDTVAKENVGFNTFGWDTGDANQDGIRNSYDEGDNGTGGGTANNGIQDGTEVFTGHKVYAETFTKVFSLKKNGTGFYDREALNRLETAINANLDPKLHITIKDDGEIVMANGAQDPWNKEYHGWYITNAEVDKQDRGAIIMYSDGANNEFGSEHKIANGIVSISIPGSNKNGKDDYAVVSVYTYLNGYGEVKNITSGFSNNQGNEMVTPNVDVVPDDDVNENPEVPTELAEGLYDANDNRLATIEELQSLGWDMHASWREYKRLTDVFSANSERFATASKLIVDDVGTPGEYAFADLNLVVIILRNCDQLVRFLFEDSTMSYLEIGGSFTDCSFASIQYCPNLIELKLPETVTTYSSYCLRYCPNLEKVNFSSNIVKIDANAFDASATTCKLQFPTELLQIEVLGQYAFPYNLSGEIVFGENLQSIGTAAFYANQDTRSLTITFLSTVPPTCESMVFHTYSGELIIKVPAESLNAYKSATGFSKLADNIFPIE